MGETRPPEGDLWWETHTVPTHIPGVRYNALHAQIHRTRRPRVCCACFIVLQPGEHYVMGNGPVERDEPREWFCCDCAIAADLIWRVPPPPAPQRAAADVSGLRVGQGEEGVE